MTKDIKNILSSENILDSIGDGIYVTDRKRKIIYWNKAAQRITGWSSQDVIGKSCMDGILCHVDKENRPLCGHGTCPLHRAIVTGSPSLTPILIYAQSSEGKRLPVQVNTAPIHNDAGEIVGGVEVFRDFSGSIDDLTRAQRIQNHSLKWEIGKNADLKAAVHYTPQDIIGGDFYTVQQLSKSKYVFFLADVMGHGISAALYTMYLRSLFDEYLSLLPDVSGFMTTLNQQLYQLMNSNFNFSAAICGLIDTQDRIVKLTGGAFPSPLLYKQSAPVRKIKISGFALGMVSNADYVTQTFNFDPGDVLFLYTDGAIENTCQNGAMLGEDGLITILQKLGYPENHFLHQQIEKQIIQHTATVALNDDLTLLEFQWPLNAF